MENNIFVQKQAAEWMNSLLTMKESINQQDSLKFGRRNSK